MYKYETGSIVLVSLLDLDVIGWIGTGNDFCILASKSFERYPQGNSCGYHQKLLKGGIR